MPTGIFFIIMLYFVFLQTGNRDEYKINIGMNMIHKILEKNKIEHYYKNMSKAPGLLNLGHAGAVTIVLVLFLIGLGIGIWKG